MTLKERYIRLVDKGYDEIAGEMLAERGIKNDFGAVYIPDGTKADDIVFKAGIFSPLYMKGIFRGGVHREVANKQFYKITLPNLRYPIIYNIDNAIKDKSFVIVTEAIYDAVSIRQSLGIDNIVSLLTASIKTEQMITLLAVFDKVYTYFDNDSAGIRAFDKLVEFKDKYYPEKEVEILLLNGAKDANEYLVKYGCDKFTKELVQQLI